jgi:hypothetical protein
MSVDAGTPPVSWRQYVVVRGESLRLLQSVSDIALRDPTANTLTLEGDGAWFPAMHGLSWAAMCCPRQPDDAALSDLAPALRTLLKAVPILFSDATAAEVETWLRAYQGDGL